MSVRARVFSAVFCILAAAAAQAAPPGKRSLDLPDTDLGTIAAAQPPPKPEDVQFSDSSPAVIQCCGGNMAGVIKLNQCAVASDHIKCTLLFIRTKEPTVDVVYNEPWASELVDNFRTVHSVTRGYFLNGRGKAVPSIPLGKDDWAWFVQEFAKGDGLDGITDFKILFRGFRRDLNAPQVELHGTLANAP